MTLDNLDNIDDPDDYIDLDDLDDPDDPDNPTDSELSKNITGFNPRSNEEGVYRTAPATPGLLNITVNKNNCKTYSRTNKIIKICGK